MNEDKEEAAKAALAKKRDEARLAEQIEQDRQDVPPGIEEVAAAELKGANVRTKLLWVQCRLRVGKNRGKGHTPNAQVGYEYRNAEDILVAVKPLCEAVNAVVTVDVVPQLIGENVPLDIRNIKSTKWKDGKQVEIETPTTFSAPRFAAIATARFSDCESGESVEARSFAFVDAWRKGQTEPEKLCGSADSYASKYALGHLFALDNNKDADQESDERGQPW